VREVPGLWGKGRKEKKKDLIEEREGKEKTCVGSGTPGKKRQTQRTWKKIKKKIGHMEEVKNKHNKRTQDQALTRIMQKNDVKTKSFPRRKGAHPFRSGS